MKDYRAFFGGRLLTLAIPAVVVLVPCRPLRAQGQTQANVTGEVTDVSKAAIPSVTITLLDVGQVFCAGLHSPGRPIGNLLFLGPTGSGKTRSVEAAAEILFGDSRMVLKVNCAEFTRGRTFKITRAANGEVVVFTMSGRMDGQSAAELKTLFGSEPNGRRIILDLRDVVLVDQDAVNFLERSEADDIQLKNHPEYVRELINRERAEVRGSSGS